uniref:Reverse transcriptase domain-containing protein n=1 Tax=Tanacetum cinerariifolium TaxID=118510 RepID=A0A6L2LIN7_TANCI|nr:hypothetical protein [Tanacetum cinerariifolium]
MPTSIVNEERIKREHEEYISLIEKLLAINSFPRPLENFHANTINETLPSSPIPVEDGDSLREKIDIFTGTDDLMPPGIESDDYDLEGDIHFLEELLVNDSISLPENESYNFDHHDDPSFPRPPLEPSDFEFLFDFEPNSEELISAVMNNIDELNEDECFDPRRGLTHNGISHWGRKRQQFYGFAVNWESALDVYSKRRIIAVTDLKIVEWHSYKHLDWISRRVEDLQLGVESYQKRLNLTKPDTYQSDLKLREAYTTYSNLRGFIYQNKDKKNRLMRVDKLYKFSDGMLNDVRTALDDRLKRIRMQYLQQTIWRKGDKDIATAMIQAIDKMLKTRRIMRSLKKFVGGRLYEEDIRMLQRTI